MSPFGNFNLARQKLKKVALKALYKLRKEMGEELWDTMRATNQSAVFEISTNQKAGCGSRDKFGREGIFEVWDRVWVRVPRGPPENEAERK